MVILEPRQGSNNASGPSPEPARQTGAAEPFLDRPAKELGVRVAKGAANEPRNLNGNPKIIA